MSGPVSGRELPNNWIIGQAAAWLWTGGTTSGFETARFEHGDEIGFVRRQFRVSIAAGRRSGIDKQGHRLHSWGGPGKDLIGRRKRYGIYVERMETWIGGGRRPTGYSNVKRMGSL